MNETQTYFIEIWPEQGSYQGRIHRGNGHGEFALGNVALGPDVVPFPERPDTLGSLVKRLARLDDAFAHEFDERFQIEVGKHLYAQTLGRIDAWDDLPDEGDVEVRIVTADEHVARLPWVLLNRRGPFLCASGWSVALTLPNLEQVDCEIPPSPRILIVAPEPPGWSDTQAADHLDELEQRLCEADHHFKRGRHLEVVSGWEEIGPALERLRPHLFYYYGHGKGNLATSHLVFAEGSVPRSIPVADLAQKLRRSAGPQLLFAYVNCCQGDAGGLLGAGRQLGEAVPAVVTNRTVAYVSAARAQALELWQALLLRGEPPHQAVSTLHARIETPGQSFANTRWMNPVLHRRYNRWTSNPPRPPSRLDRDPHWHVKIDRVKQFGQVFMETDQMLRERRPRALAYLWYGEEGQGVALFHQRLQVELRERLAGAMVLELKPRWPDELRNPYRSFEDMIAEACEIQDFSDFTAWIRAQAQFERRTVPLVHVRHEPLRQGDVVKPSDLETYLEWWHEQLAPCLEDAGAFGLLGVSFLARKNAARLRERLQQALEDLDLDDLVFHVLDEFEKLALEDLRNFLRSHNVALPRTLRDRVLIRILEKTGGRYEMTLNELKKVVDQAWDDESAGDGPSAQPAEDEDDW